MTGMPGQSGIEHLLHAGVSFEKGGDRMCAVTVLAHTHCQRLDPAEHEPAVERSGHGAEGFLQEREPFRDGWIVRRREAANDVGVAAEILRRRMDDDVRAELNGRWRNGVANVLSTTRIAPAA
jgi:hypothetical protein